MNSFGLGLVLNFTDNASAGMRRVSQTFNEMNGLASKMVDSSNSAVYSIETLTAAGIGLSMVGDNLSQAGSAITGLFTSITQSVLDTGSKMLGFRMQLQALYGEDAYEQKMKEIQQYAKNSVFTVEGLMSSVTMMKTVGIEAMDEITTSSGNTTQKLLDYASDIAAMVPNMRNTYGTGVKAAMGAIKEYIAEGNALSLKRGAGFDITGILGEDKGKTIEERTRQVADLTEKLGIARYTKSLADTPIQQLAKIQDILFNTMSSIADSGVFDSYTALLTRVATWLDTLTSDTEKYNTIVSVLGDTISTIMTPLNYLLDIVIKVAEAFIDFADNNPKLAKGILVAVAGFGALLVVLGTALKLAGSFFLLTGALMQMNYLAKNGLSIFNIFGRGIGIVLSKMIPFIAIAGLAYLAWKDNFLGIRDLVTGVFKDLGSIFSLVGDAWGDNTLSEDQFQKAKDLGLLPLIEALLQLKYYWGFLVDGFKTGFKAFFDGVEEVLSKIGVFDVSIMDIVASFGEFLKSLTEIGAEDKWSKIGEALGKIAGAIIVIFGAFKLLKGAFTIVTTIGTLFSKVGGIFKVVGSVIMTILSAIGAALGIPAAAVAGLIVLVISSAITLYEKFGEIAGYIWTTLSEIVGGIVTIFTGIIEFVKGIFTGDWKMAWEGICSIFRGIWDTLGAIVKGVINGIILVINVFIATVYRVLAGVVNGIGSIFGFIAGALGFEDAGFSIPKDPPQIPYLADGGVAIKPTPAVVGDGPEKEAILPLNTKVFSEIAKGISNQKPAQSQTVQNDYSVTFSAGSVVIQLANATEAELEKAAEKLMKIIERKQQLKAMAVRA